MGRRGRATVGFAAFEQRAGRTTSDSCCSSRGSLRDLVRARTPRWPAILGHRLVDARTKDGCFPATAAAMSTHAQVDPDTVANDGLEADGDCAAVESPDAHFVADDACVVAAFGILADCLGIVAGLSRRAPQTPWVCLRTRTRSCCCSHSSCLCEDCLCVWTVASHRSHPRPANVY